MAPEKPSPHQDAWSESRLSESDDILEANSDKSSTALLGHPTRSSSHAASSRSKKTACLKALMVHAALFTAYAALLTLLIGHRRRVAFGPDTAFSAGSVYTPAHNAIKFEKVRFSARPHALNADLAGDPRPVHEAAWKALLAATDIRVTEDMLHKTFPNRAKTPVKISDAQGGYLGMLEVMHQLHCVKTIRIALAPELYPDWAQSLAKKPGEKISHHVDHCLGLIAQSLICHADSTLLVSDWDDDHVNPEPHFDVSHNCVNWDLLMQWNTDHHVNASGKLIHPKYGVFKPWESENVHGTTSNTQPPP